ncbi:MAG: hypothetical protein WBA54_10200, partial [Acidaminobacteraceae bacterium]
MKSLYAIGLLIIFILVSLIYLKKVSESKSSKNQLESVLRDLKNIKSKSELDLKLEKIYIGSKSSVVLLESAAKVNDKAIKKDLVERALVKKSDEILDVIEISYNKFDSESKFLLLEYLSIYGSPKSMQMFIDFLMIDHMNFVKLPIEKLNEHPRYADIVFPKLMELGLAEEKRYQVYDLVNTYLKNKLIFSDKVESLKENVLMQYKNIAYDYERYNDRGRMYWRYDVPMYMETRAKMLTLIELLGYMFEEEILIELRRAVKFNDPLVNAYSLIALVKLGESIDDYVMTMDELCEFPEVRKYLYFELERLNLKMKFPYEFRSQQYLAQSEVFNLFTLESKIYAEPMNIKFYSKIDISDKYSLYAFVCEIKYSREENVKTILAYSGPFLNDEIETSGCGLTSIR